jgi:CubicO group peptidase (beta-lactamase class C family)
MRKYTTIFLLTTLLLFQSNGISDSKELVQNNYVASNIALLEAWLNAQMAYRGIPGATIGIVYDQDLIYAKGFGYADLSSKKLSDPGTIYRIASHSKLFTAIAIMQLRDKGQLDLDDPVKKHLTWFDIVDTYPHAPEITIRHLLTHTSGLPREAGSAYWLDFDFPTTEQIKKRLVKQQTIYPSETRWKYSNLALALTGEIVATVSGRSFSDYVEDNIIKPLGMSGTSVVFPPAHSEKLATGYGRRLPDGSRETFPFVDARGMAAAAGVSSSVLDMAKFISWQFRLRYAQDNRVEVLQSNTLREMQRVHWVHSDWKSGWGLGFNIVHTGARELIGHGGGYPGYTTATYISPEEKVGVIVFTNAADAQPYVGDPLSIIDRAFKWIGPAITKALVGTPVPEPEPDWKDFEGIYRTRWADIHILSYEGKLILIYPTSPNPEETALTLEPVSQDTFKLEGKGYGELGEPVVFQKNNTGYTKSVRIGENTYVRVNY